MCICGVKCSACYPCEASLMRPSCFATVCPCSMRFISISHASISSLQHFTRYLRAFILIARGEAGKDSLESRERDRWQTATIRNGPPPQAFLRNPAKFRKCSQLIPPSPTRDRHRAWLGAPGWCRLSGWVLCGGWCSLGTDSRSYSTSSLVVIAAFSTTGSEQNTIPSLAQS